LTGLLAAASINSSPTSNGFPSDAHPSDVIARLLFGQQLSLGQLLCYAQTMKKAGPVMRKRGRPATGRNPTIALRASDAFRVSVEKWASRQSGRPTLSEAIRRLVEMALSIKPKSSRSHQTALGTKADKAKELAGKAIDGMADDLASLTEKESRKQRLLKGPEEFRKLRVDRTKSGKAKK
jgi:hypothetical protein